MKYWAYTNNEVGGPFEKEQLAKLPGFTASSLICPETPAGGQTPDWKEAAAYPEVTAALASPGQTHAPAPVRTRPAESESPLAMTMRGTLIEPVVTEPAAGTPAAFSLTPINALKPAAIEPPKETPRPLVPGKTQVPSENIPAGQEPGAGLEPLKQKVEQMGGALVAIRKSQGQLLEELNRLESAVAEMKALLSSEPQKNDHLPQSRGQRPGAAFSTASHTPSPQ